ncbi:partial Biopolymer transport protein ExbD, partial [Rhodocyclaceae bacterium]
MAFGSFNEGGNTQPMVEINTTPLVDVMLVLLVIFIITAPLFHQAVPIDLPKVDSTRLDDKPKVIQVALDAAGQAYVNGEAVTAAALD